MTSGGRSVRLLEGMIDGVPHTAEASKRFDVRTIDLLLSQAWSSSGPYTCTGLEQN
jgi:hypothetical protein